MKAPNIKICNQKPSMFTNVHWFINHIGYKYLVLKTFIRKWENRKKNLLAYGLGDVAPWPLDT
jgi:hypothetical protein